MFFIVIFYWKPHFLLYDFCLEDGLPGAGEPAAVRVHAQVLPQRLQARREEPRATGLGCAAPLQRQVGVSTQTLLKFWAVWATGSRSGMYEIKGFCVSESLFSFFTIYVLNLLELVAWVWADSSCLVC